MRIQRVLGFALAFCLLASVGVAAERTAETFLLVFIGPNLAEAPNGDKVAVTGQGAFSVHQKSVLASGTFEHTDFAGNVLGGGTWMATQLLSYQSYGCGVFAGVDPPIVL